MNRIKLPSGLRIDLDKVANWNPLREYNGNPTMAYYIAGESEWTDARGEDAVTLFAALEATLAPPAVPGWVSKADRELFEAWRSRGVSREGTKLYGFCVTDDQHADISHAAIIAGGPNLGQSIARVCREWAAAREAMKGGT